MGKRYMKYEEVKADVKALFIDLPEVALLRQLQDAFSDNGQDVRPGDVLKACEELVKEGVLQHAGRPRGMAYEATEEFIEEQGIEVDE